VRHNNWKFYFTMPASSAAGGFAPPVPYKWTQVQNIMRDPFEQAVGDDQKTLLSVGGALASPSTAYLYNWNLLPVGQALWEKELQSYVAFPPLQHAASYNLEQVLQQVKEMANRNPSQ
jgi:arylsulfatase